MRKKSELIHIPTRYPVTSIAWHPTESTILMTTSGDDHNPVVQTWDLRNANAPKAVMSAHEKAILSLAWCSRDPDLILTGSADNRSLITNAAGGVVAELPVSGQWVHCVAWCFQPSIVATASLEGKICIYSLQDTAAPAPVEVIAGDDFFDSIPKNLQSSTFTLKQTPQWLKPPVGAKFGLLGKLTSFTDRKVQIATYRANEDTVKQARQIKSILTGFVDYPDEPDWDVIRTLTSEAPRDALLKHLGFEHTKPVAEPEEDDFAGIAEKQAFEMYAGDSEADNVVTKAILTGQFDKAIDVCLKEDRMSDAFMLALCGGAESQKRVQKAYFEKTAVPYARLLSSIIAGDLRDIVDKADSKSWKEILAILCNYAKPDDFPDLCEALGERLDEESAITCYLAGSKLEKLVGIWAKDNSTLGLGELIKKVSLFRKAVSYKDAQVKVGDKYVLAPLYRCYVQYAQALADEGDFDLANEYLALVPSSFDGVDALKTRITPQRKAIQAQPEQTQTKRSGLRNVYVANQPTYVASQPSPASYTTPSAGQANQNQYNTASVQQQQSQPAQSNAYKPAPAQNAYSPYAPVAPAQQAYTPYSQPPAQPAPPRNGPSVLPAAQRKDITPWNDAPDVPMAAPRRATPTVHSIASPFPNQPSPTLQGFTAPSGPPPKTTSKPRNGYASPQPPIAQAPPTSFAPQQVPYGGLPAASAPPPAAFAPPPQASTFTPPPPAASFAPPPKATKSSASPRISSPVVGNVPLSREPSRPSTPEKRPEPVAKYPAGDRTHIMESNLQIYHDLSAEISRLRAGAPEKYRRPLEDTDRRLNLMFDQLNNGQLTDGTLEQLKILSSSIKRQDWQRAYAVQLELTTDKMHECRDWITGTKALIVVGKNVA